MSNEQEPGQDQAPLFVVNVELRGNGSTDATTHQIQSNITFGSVDGETVPPETKKSEAVQPDRVLEAVRNQVLTDKHRRAQLGRHSALRDGKYDPQPGDVMPGGLVVTGDNLKESQRKAEQLNAERQRGDRRAG